VLILHLLEWEVAVMSWTNREGKQITKQMSLFSQIVLGISLALMTIFSTPVSYLF
jgi:hypothetical protein